MTRYRVAIIGTGPYVQLPSPMYDSFVKWLLPKLLWSKVANDLAPQQPHLSHAEVVRRLSDKATVDSGPDSACQWRHSVAR